MFVLSCTKETTNDDENIPAGMTVVTKTSYASDGTFTIANTPNGYESIKFAFKTSGLKLTGIWPVRNSSSRGGYTWESATADMTDTEKGNAEKQFIRIVKVTDVAPIVLLADKGNTVWWGWKTTGTNTYYQQHYGTISNGILTEMNYLYNGQDKYIDVHCILCL